jgi:hypothetical protein
MQFQTEAKVTYETPNIADYGDLVELTAAADPNANFLDADFPAGTPRDELTFS